MKDFQNTAAMIAENFANLDIYAYRKKAEEFKEQFNLLYYQSEEKPESSLKVICDNSQEQCPYEMIIKAKVVLSGEESSTTNGDIA